MNFASVGLSQVMLAGWFMDFPVIHSILNLKIF